MSENLVGIWSTPNGEKSEIIFKNGFYYARHLEHDNYYKKSRAEILKYIRFYKMEKVD